MDGPTLRYVLSDSNVRRIQQKTGRETRFSRSDLREGEVCGAQEKKTHPRRIIQ